MRIVDDVIKLGDSVVNLCRALYDSFVSAVGDLVKLTVQLLSSIVFVMFVMVIIPVVACILFIMSKLKL